MTQKTTATRALAYSLMGALYLAGHAGPSMADTSSSSNTAPATAQAADPYQWLEDVTGTQALDWVRARNKLTRERLDADPGFVPLRAELLKVLDSKDRIPTLDKMGQHYYNFWTDAQHPKGVWRKTTLEEYRKKEPAWQTVLDVDALGAQEKENWVFHGANCRYPQYDRCMLALSRGGADAAVMREFDLATQSFVTGPQAFSLPEAKARVAWRDRDTLFVGTDFGPGSLTDSGYPRIVKLWQRGTPLTQAKTVFEGQASDVAVSAYVSEHGGVRHALVHRAITFYTSENFLLEDDGKLTKLDLPAKADLGFFGKQILVSPREPWTTGGSTYPAGSLLAMDFEAFLRKGERKFQLLFTPSDSTSLSGYSVTQNCVLVEALDNVKSKLMEWRLGADGQWAQRAVALPTLGAVHTHAVDDQHSDAYWLSYSDYLTPSVYLLAQAGSDQRELLKSTPAFFDAAPYETVQYLATSKDGTKVPYFVVKRKDLAPDSANPTLLYGYGGFEISMTPAYSGGLGKAWLDKGGVYVVANIRGGGEFGPRWHEAALKANRQRAYDDFAAVAQDLIARKLTSPAHLGAMGGSNGGLLAGVALTQHPELFNAVVSQVPLLDMRRYNKLLAGASWMGEYGNPDLPEEWAFISQYSPYQNVQAGVKYPNVLFITSTRDDRVHPGHARKMAAKMLGQGHGNVWYYENIEGGHGGAADNAQRADMSAITWSFLWTMLKRDNAANLAH
jgi:prolyl oligopeptidase